jgi:hypothetical protein
VLVLVVLSSGCSGMVGLCIAVSLVASNFLSTDTFISVFDLDMFISVFEVLQVDSVLIRWFIWMIICSDRNEWFHCLLSYNCTLVKSNSDTIRNCIFIQRLSHILVVFISCTCTHILVVWVGVNF